jgi:hypothetical protein
MEQYGGKRSATPFSGPAHLFQQRVNWKVRRLPTAATREKERRGCDRRPSFWEG